MSTTDLSPPPADEHDGLVARLSRIFARGGRGPSGGGAKAGFETSEETLERYVADMPSGQTAIDSLPGWIGAMPPQTGLKAGKTPLFADTRINWLVRECFDVAGKTVLELGPLEGSHTYMLHRAGAASIDAIEANTIAFHRCLIAKEVLGLSNARFHLGDFLKWLEATDKRYDLIVASGVLYHSDNPVRLLELLAEKSDALFLWTHYFDEAAMPPGDPRRKPFSESIEQRETGGLHMRLHERSYFKAWQDPKFCGGLQDRHFWIERADLLAFIKARGFVTTKIAHDDPKHSNGPSFSVFASRVAAAEPARRKPMPPKEAASSKRDSAKPPSAVNPAAKSGKPAARPGSGLLLISPEAKESPSKPAGSRKNVPGKPQPPENRPPVHNKAVNRPTLAASKPSGGKNEA